MICVDGWATCRRSRVGDAEGGGSMRAWFSVRAAGVAVILVAAVFAAAPASWAGTANGGLKGAQRSNPIAGVTWRPYEGSTDPLWTAYASAQGRRRRLLGRL